MADRSEKISLAKRQLFIKNLPCFSMLTDRECSELAGLLTEVKCAPGSIIVAENAPVDSVYIIAAGQTEINHESIIKRRKLIKKMTQVVLVPVGLQTVGDTIGLNDTGFFSLTGKRTATIIAVTDVLLLRLDIKQLHDFLARHSHLKPEMLATTKQMLRMRLIKQSLAFSRLSHERLQWLADKVEEETVLAGTCIFQEGDQGDKCYLICNGAVEIISKNEDGTEHQLAVLRSPTLFGEATLIAHEPRNATAHVLEDCELLVLKHHYLSELIESERNTANTFMSLMVDRSRPLKNPNIIDHQRTTPDQQLIVILKNPANGSYFKLSEEGWYIWQQMNGKQTMREITLALAEKFNVFAPDIVAALISKLAKAGFVVNVETQTQSVLALQPRWVRTMLKIRRVLESRVAFGDADKWITMLYQRGAYLLFTRCGKIILFTLICLGLFTFGFTTSYVITLFRTIHDSWILLICLIPATLFSVALHELGHALATKAFGYEVHYMGIGWYWLGPVAFTDTSDMWLSTRGPRIFVNLAGVYTDLLVGGIAAMLILLMPSAHLQAFLWLFALFTYISAFRMLNPLQELDGYYALMDAFDRPRLRQAAVLWLVKGFPKAVRKPKLFKQHIPEICYWLACITFIILVSLITLLLQSFIFKILGFKPANLLMSLLLPIIVAAFSCLGIIADVRSQAD
jgi:putative peptide zinc metalloprotease protein